tara:strand:- start:97 stop:423 length:327 start_codon:yes stop_codon:yes gene_type:complete
MYQFVIKYKNMDQLNRNKENLFKKVENSKLLDEQESFSMGMVVSVMNFIIKNQLEIQEKEKKLKIEAQESLYLTVGQCNDVELKKKMLSSEFNAYQKVLSFIQKQLNK